MPLMSPAVSSSSNLSDIWSLVLPFFFPSPLALWLDVLEGIPEAERDFIVQMYIGGLRRRLGLHQPKDVVRAQTQSACAASARGRTRLIESSAQCGR